MPAWFEEWRGGAFYPEGLKQKEELAYASRHVTTIEINSTFYSYQKPTSFQSWAANTPEDFVFPVKSHQNITHIKRLKDVEIPLANFFASGPLALGSRLGPFVWQPPGNLKYDPVRIETFLKLLPKTPADLLALAKKHDERSPPLSLTSPASTACATRWKSVISALPTGLHRHAARPQRRARRRRYGRVADLLTDRRLHLLPLCRAHRQGPPPTPISTMGPPHRPWAAGRLMTDGTFIAPPRLRPPADVFAHFVSTDKKNAPKNARRWRRKSADGGFTWRLLTMPPPGPKPAPPRYRGAP